MNRSLIRSIIALIFLLPLFLLFNCSKPEKNLSGMGFDEIIDSARGARIRFFMWGGDAKINNWIDGYVSASLREKYDIELQRVPMDASVFINKLLTEKLANKQRGVIDLLWINGENFKRAKENDLLFGPFAERLPSIRYCDPKETAYDFAVPTDGYEVPYGKAQFVFEYDSAKFSDPPRNFRELKKWVQDNPGRFTYPEPPDFTGSAFVRQIFYLATGGHAQYMDGFDESLYSEKVPALWDYLLEIKPFLWKKGKTYPKTKSSLDLLFERGEVLINMSYHQAAASGRILDGRYPETVRTFVFDGASLSNIHFTAISYNSEHKAAAMVTADFLLSPPAQYSKNLPENWGDFTVLDFDRLPQEEARRFLDIDLGPATLSIDVLNRNAVPEIPIAYLEELEKDWAQNILSGK